MKTLVYAFISSQTDYCNKVFTGISDQLLQRLQAIQNAAARLITGARRSQHMTLRLPHCINCTCHQYDNIFSSRRPCWCTSPRHPWLHLTCQYTACQPHRTTVGVIYALLYLDNFLFHIQRLTTVTTVSLSVV